ncbi:casparian strip membrane protein 5-like [Oryza brachyantha]|uniref:CASP-like protein n=1 Tax=Oryza brachyantha TaxID=4533 RepID=J3LE58_ORYBR|nr:casparian strip membrane protein 5-like [Oryza brachyantha]
MMLRQSLRKTKSIATFFVTKLKITGSLGSMEHGETSGRSKAPPGANRVLSVADLVLRFVAIGGTAGSAIAMATTSETLPFATPFVQLRAEYSDLPTFMFFVVASSVVCGYLVLSLPASVLHVVRPTARCSRAVLALLDAVMLAVLTAGASAAAAIVYLAHRGSTARANWFAICQQFTSFCERTTASLVGSFAAAVLLVALVFLSALALARRT